MKVLFVYGEAKVIVDDEKNKYTNGTITDDAWNDRYKILGDVTFMAKRSAGLYSKEEASRKFCKIDETVKYIELENNTANLKNFISLKLLNSVKDKIEKEVMSCDCLIARIPSEYSYIAIDCATKYKKKYFVEVVGCAWDSYWNHGLKGKLVAPIEYLKLKKYVKNAPHLIYVSNNFLQRRYPSKGNSICCSNVVLNNIDIDNLNKRLEKIKHKDSKEKIIIGTCGGLDVIYKGQQYVLKALSILKSMGYNNFEYQVVGNGTGERLTELANKLGIMDKLKIVGCLPHDNVLKWMDSLDIYIQPSDQEGLCRSIIEAESRACPVIASNAGGNSELVSDAFIFKKKDFSELARKIVDMNSDIMLKEAKKNFNNSKQYQKNILLERRRDFSYRFRMECGKND